MKLKFAFSLLLLIELTFAVTTPVDSLLIRGRRNANVLGTTATGMVVARSRVDTATYALNAANATVYNLLPAVARIVMFENDSLKWQALCDMVFPPEYHLHSANTLPDSLNHHVAGLQIPVSRGGRLWRGSGATVDTVYGDAFFPRNFFLGDSIIRRAIFSGLLGTITDRNMDSSILWFSPYGTGDAQRGPYIVFGGNESSYPSLLLSGGDSGNVIISSDSLRQTIIAGGRLEWRLNASGGTSNDALQMQWNDVMSGDFHIFSKDTTKGIVFSQAFVNSPEIWIDRHQITISGGGHDDTLFANFESLIHFTTPQFWIGSAAKHAYIDSTSIRSDTVEAINALIVDTTLVTSVSETIPDDGLDSIFSISLPVGSTASGNISYSIVASSGTLRTVHSGIVTFAAVNENGSITADIDEVYLPSNETLIGSGSLSDTWSIVAGSNSVIVRLVSNSALTTPTIRVRCVITLHSLNTVIAL